MAKTDSCPACGSSGDPAHAPFCSRGCKDRDLLRWLSDGYAIPGEPVDPEALDRLESRD